MCLIHEVGESVRERIITNEKGVTREMSVYREKERGKKERNGFFFVPDQPQARIRKDPNPTSPIVTEAASLPPAFCLTGAVLSAEVALVAVPPPLLVPPLLSPPRFVE